MIKKLQAHCTFRGLFCVFRFFFFQPLRRIIRKGEGVGKDFIPTKCLWGRLLVLAAGKELLERRISVQQLKQSPWQPVLKLDRLFIDTLYPGGLLHPADIVFASVSQKSPSLPIQLRTCSDVKTPIKGIPCSLLNGSFGEDGVTFYESGIIFLVPLIIVINEIYFF